MSRAIWRQAGVLSRRTNGKRVWSMQDIGQTDQEIAEFEAWLLAAHAWAIERPFSYRLGKIRAKLEGEKNG